MGGRRSARGAGPRGRTTPGRTGVRPQPGSYPLTGATARVERDHNVADGWLLYVDEAPSSYLDLDDATHLEFEYMGWIADVLDTVAAPPPAPLQVAHVGGAACTLPGYVAATRPESQQVVFEIDPALVELARAQFGVRSRAGLRIRVREGREGVARLAPGGTDVIVRDAFGDGVVPVHLCTVEFLDEVVRALTPAGCYVANLVDAVPLAQARAEVATALARFTHVALLAEPAVFRGRRHGNLVLVASQAPLPHAELARRLRIGVAPARLVAGAELAQLATGVPVLTDRDPGRPAPRRRDGVLLGTRPGTRLRATHQGPSPSVGR